MRDRLDEIAAWPLDRINSERVVLAVWSDVLDREVLFAYDGWQRPGCEERPVFSVTELRKLASLRPRPAELRSVAEAKSIFKGTITDA